MYFLEEGIKSMDCCLWVLFSSEPFRTWIEEKDFIIDNLFSSGFWDYFFNDHNKKDR